MGCRRRAMGINCLSQLRACRGGEVNEKDEPSARPWCLFDLPESGVR